MSRRPSALPGLLALAVLAPALAACGEGAAEEPAATPAPATSPAAPVTPSQRVPDVSGTQVPADLAADLTALLDERARALRVGDAAAYDALLDTTDAGFVTAQQGYFDNLAQLPVAELTYDVQPASLVRQGRDYWVVVGVGLRLRGFDDETVHTYDRFRFSPSGPDGAFRLSSVTDRRWEKANDVPQQPWDLEPVQVVKRGDVLGVFDAGTAAYADRVVAAVRREAPDVAGQVPYGWTGSTVLYALSDDAFLDTLEVPGGDPATLDGLTFSLPVSASDPTIAATRVVLQPDVLDQPAAERDRLLRHELTHLAVGVHDDGAPVWLSEGIAEYVSVRRQAPAQRRVSSEALAAARAGVRRMPADDTFNDADSAVHYGVSWWTCEHLAATYGPAALWTLLDQLARPGVDPVAVTRRLTGTTPDQLARRGAKLLVETYAPESSRGRGQGSRAAGAGGAGGAQGGRDRGGDAAGAARGEGQGGGRADRGDRDARDPGGPRRAGR